MEAAEENHRGIKYFDDPEVEYRRDMVYLDDPEFESEEETVEEYLIGYKLLRRLIEAEKEGKEITDDDENRMLEDITTEVKRQLEEQDAVERERMEKDAVERERMEEDACMQVKIREDGERYSQWRRSEQRCPGYSRFMMHSCSVKSEKKQKEIKRKMIKKTKARSFHLFKNLLNTNKKRITRMKGKRGGRRR